MPVFARSKLLIEEKCLTYRPKMTFSYSGPNPQKSYQKIVDILVKDLSIPRGNLQEKGFQWDRSGKHEKFKVAFEVIKDFDKFTYLYLEIDMDGEVKPSKEFGKEGHVSITMQGTVRTEYPQDTAWERSYIYEMFRTFFHKVFYHDKVKRYVAQCRDWMLYIADEMKSFFNLLQKM